MSTKIYDGDSIVATLGGRRYSKGWSFRCPAHHDRHPSCYMWRNGAIKCFAGCSYESITAALDAAGFIKSDGLQAEPATLHQDREEDIDKARRLWNVFAYSNDPRNTAVVENYLRLRAITVPVPTSVMRRFGPDGYIVCVQQPDNSISAVFTRRFFERGRSYGVMGRGAVKLAPVLNGELGLAEGCETALAAMELTGVPVWATLGCWRLHQIFIPSSVKLLHIFADADRAGQEALHRATRRYTLLGFKVRQRTPIGVKDFADILQRTREA